MARNVRVGETDSNQLRAYFEVRLLDLQSPALGEAGGTPEYNLNAGGWNSVGIGQLVAAGFGRYYAQISPSLITTPGDEILTRYKSAVTAESWGDSLIVVAAGSVPADDVSISHYGSVVEGDAYFANSLRGRTWKKRSVDQRRVALIDATQIIDRLNFAGDKADDQQVLQFPRGNSYIDPIMLTETITGDVNVPGDVKRAAYVIADRLLDGWDPDIEADMLASQSSKYQGVSTSYNREYIPEHMRAGIPSAYAWTLLRPYVRDPRTVTITRV